MAMAFGTQQPSKWKSIEEVFWDRIDKDGSGGCWLWKGNVNHNGYGRLSYQGRKEIPAHRFAYEYLVGKIPDGKLVRHTCDVPLCVNPEHLLFGTPADNGRDKAERGRAVWGERHPHARFTEGQVREIRRVVADGFSRRSVARLLGVPHATICSIVNRRTWGHVP